MPEWLSSHDGVPTLSPILVFTQDGWHGAGARERDGEHAVWSQGLHLQPPESCQKHKIIATLRIKEDETQIIQEDN